MASSRTRVSIQTKIKIIQEYNKGVLPQRIALKFGVSKSFVYAIRKDEVAILKNYKSLKDPNNKEVENVLYKWYVAQREGNIDVRDDDLMVRAADIHMIRYRRKFHENKVWLADFKNRFDIRLDEKFVSRAQLEAHFKKQLPDIMDAKKLSLDVVFKADVSGLFWASLPNSRFCSGTTRDMPRERITFLVCSNASGSQKLTPFVVGKVRKPRSFMNKDLPVDYAFSDSARITGNLIINWFFEKFIPQVEAFFEAAHLPKQAILLLDKMPGFPSEEVLAQTTIDGEICAMYLPQPAEEPSYQTMDASTITKLWYKKILLHKIKSSKYNICGSFVRINLFDVALMLMISWEKVPMVFINKLWRSYFAIETEFGQKDEAVAELRTEGENVFTVEDIWRWINIDQHLDGNTSETELTSSDDEYVAT